MFNYIGNDLNIIEFPNASNLVLRDVVIVHFYLRQNQDNTFKKLIFFCMAFSDQIDVKHALYSIILF